jgi:hypothetical protein
VTLTDSNIYTPLSKTYKFKISVEVQANSTDNSTVDFNNTKGNSGGKKNNSNYDEIMEDIKQTSLTAKVTSIKSTGRLTITFSETMIIPTNFSLFNDSIL